jgi:hypothetical protein
MRNMYTVVRGNSSPPLEASQRYRRAHPERVEESKPGGQLDFDVDWYRDDIRMQPCSYCGEGAGTNGADRLDNLLPYVKTNIVPSCIRCNLMKGARLSSETFVEHCKTIVNYQANKQIVITS